MRPRVLERGGLRERRRPRTVCRMGTSADLQLSRDTPSVMIRRPLKPAATQSAHRQVDTGRFATLTKSHTEHSCRNKRVLTFRVRPATLSRVCGFAPIAKSSPCQVPPWCRSSVTPSRATAMWASSCRRTSRSWLLVVMAVERVTRWRLRSARPMLLRSLLLKRTSTSRSSMPHALVRRAASRRISELASVDGVVWVANRKRETVYCLGLTPRTMTRRRDRAPRPRS